MKKIDIIIPASRYSNILGNVIKRLLKQTIKPECIYILYRGRDSRIMQYEDLSDIVKVIRMSPRLAESDMKNLAVYKCEGDIICFLAETAKPYNEHMLERLIDPLINKGINFSYGRQLAKGDCQEVERCAQINDYPSKPFIVSKNTADKTGIGAYMFSDVCSAYIKSEFEKLEGFEEGLPFGCDRVFSARAVNAGEKIAYCHDAVVIYSRNYSLSAQFKRYFDAGVLKKDLLEAEGYKDDPGNEGKLYAKNLMYLLDYREYLWLGYDFLYNGAKYAGYLAGNMQRFVPGSIKKKLSAHPEYFHKQ